MHRVYPSFLVKGTTLTLSALTFIAFVYESSNLTWCDLADKFCDQENKIVHSTLFKAVHGLGKSLGESNKKIREAVEELTSQYLFPALVEESDPAWPSEKSRYEHTLKHENSLREITEAGKSVILQVIQPCFHQGLGIRTLNVCLPLPVPGSGQKLYWSWLPPP